MTPQLRHAQLGGMTPQLRHAQLRCHGPRRRAALGALVLGALIGLLGSCSTESELTQLDDDPSRVTVPGPPPTAPPLDDSTSGVAGASRLISDLEELAAEDDLCEVLGGDAFAQLAAADPDATGIVTSPAGVTQLFALIERTFDHLVAISPADVQPSMVVVRDVWVQVASLGPAPDADERVQAIVSQPPVVEAVQQLALWGATNCPGAGGLAALGLG